MGFQLVLLCCTTQHFQNSKIYLNVFALIHVCTFAKSIYSPTIHVTLSMIIKSSSVSKHMSCVLCLTKLNQKWKMLENRNQQQFMFNDSERIISMQIAPVFWLSSSKMCPPLTRGNAGILALSPLTVALILCLGFWIRFVIFKNSSYQGSLRFYMYSIHFTLTLGGTQNIVHYIEDFIKQRFVKLGFHCTLQSQLLTL